MLPRSVEKLLMRYFILAPAMRHNGIRWNLSSFKLTECDQCRMYEPHVEKNRLGVLDVATPNGADGLFRHSNRLRAQIHADDDAQEAEILGEVPCAAVDV